MMDSLELTTNNNQKQIQNDAHPGNKRDLLNEWYDKCSEKQVIHSRLSALNRNINTVLSYITIGLTSFGTVFASISTSKEVNINSTIALLVNAGVHFVTLSIQGLKQISKFDEKGHLHGNISNDFSELKKSIEAQLILDDVNIDVHSILDTYNSIIDKEPSTRACC